MKKVLIILGAAALVLAGCATTHVASVAPVGPSPGSAAFGTGTGQLEVYSDLSGRVEGNNPTRRQHSDYYLLSLRGRRLHHVMNSNGNYSTTPRVVILSAGEYVVKARAKDSLWIKVPVVIKPNELTQVHLDGNWQPNVSESKLVMAPAGYAVGWRAGK